VFPLDLVGQGCGAALPNLRAAEAILTAGRAKKVLSVCVEVCSAAFYLDDDPGVLISACLFGDGACAAVLANKPQPNRRRVEWKWGSSHLAPDKRDALRFEHKTGCCETFCCRRSRKSPATKPRNFLPNRFRPPA
jgi:alkylresorcinol/alkylpyrone synthase